MAIYDDEEQMNAIEDRTHELQGLRDNARLVTGATGADAIKRFLGTEESYKDVVADWETIRWGDTPPSDDFIQAYLTKVDEQKYLYYKLVTGVMEAEAEEKKGDEEGPGSA